MSFDFPNAPMLGDHVRAPNGALWRWDGAKWLADSAGQAVGGGNGTVTQVGTGTGLSGGPIILSGTISLANTAVTPGSYTAANITVDQQGRLTAATNGAAPPSPSSTTPLMDGGAVVGVSAAYARADHVHPTDTTRAPIASPAFAGNGSIAGTWTVGGAMTVGGGGINYTAHAGHAFAASWDGSYWHNWVDGSDVGRTALIAADNSLTIAGEIRTPTIYRLTASGAYFYTDPSVTQIVWDSGLWRLVYNRANGRLSYIQGGSNAELFYVDGAGNAGHYGSLTVANLTDFSLFRAAGTARVLQFAAGGWQLSWQESGGALIWFSAGAQGFVYSPAAANLLYNNLGQVAGHGPYADLSDAALKTDIADAPHGLTEILQLVPKTYTRRPRVAGQAFEPELGFVAQDVQDVLPEAVRSMPVDDEQLLAVMTTPIVAALVGAVKELSARVVALEGGRGG